eukprot:588954-Pleurochrysis_carterae.AAC.1
MTFFEKATLNAVEKMSAIRKLGTQGKGAGQGSGHRWWPWYVRAMVMEQLVNRTPPDRSFCKYCE